MSKTLQVFMLLAVALYFALLVFFLRRRRINLKYSLLWLFFGIVMLLLALFPRILDWAAEKVGIVTPVNALFAITLFCIIIILMSLTAIVSRLNNQLVQLAQANALLEQRVRELEKGGTQHPAAAHQKSDASDPDARCVS